MARVSTKPCTGEEIAACESQECAKGKSQCEKFGYVHDCAKGLAKCPGLPVKMPKESCVTKYLSVIFEDQCKEEGPECVVYEDGACTLNAERYKVFDDYMDRNFYGDDD